MFACDMLAHLFDQNPYMATILVDKDGVVVFINETYARILGLKRREIVGKHIGEITPDSRTLVALKTGKAIVGYNWIVNGRNMIACALPIYQDKRIIGSFAYSICLDIWDAKNLVEDLLFELNMYKDEVHSLLRAKYDFDDIIGEDDRFRQVKSLAEQIAHHSNTTVMITGESGTGKELFAHAIHNASCRFKFPFVRVNCAAIPDNLLESELFGYEEGAYTGAKKEGKLGKFELANGGTIFLDEIGEMPLNMQSKLLVVLQEHVIERLGGTHPVKVNVRVITATNRDLHQMIQAGKFREDLYYRLNVVHLKIPPLRHRKKDIPLLVDYFLNKLNTRLKTLITKVTKKGLNLLCEYHWPGNVRELENVLERAIIMADMEGARKIDGRHLPFLESDKVVTPPLQSTGASDLKTIMEEYERKTLVETLEKSNYDKKLVAEFLKIDLSSLYRKLRKYQIIE